MTEQISSIQKKFFWQCLIHTAHTNLMGMFNWNNKNSSNYDTDKQNTGPCRHI